MIIFVYGTLLKGLERSHVLYSSPYLGPALVQAQLFDLGSYPGIGEGNHDVTGELYEVTPETLAELDSIEGYVENSPESSLYLRKTLTAQKFADGSTVDAESYFYSRPSGELIEGGDYRSFRIQRERPERQWIIAYGSNISSDRINRRFLDSGVGLADEYKKGILPGFELVFNKNAYADDSVYANICFKGGDDGCYATAWALSSEQISVIDRCEGAPRHYMRAGVLFEPEGESTQIVQCYLAHPDKVVDARKPREDYLGLIKDGYFEMEWPSAALERFAE